MIPNPATDLKLFFEIWGGLALLMLFILFVFLVVTGRVTLLPRKREEDDEEEEEEEEQPKIKPEIYDKLNNNGR